MASSADLGGSGLAHLGSWTIAQLRDLAQRIGLGGYSRMDKKGLLDAVNQALPKAQSSGVLTAEHTPEGVRASMVRLRQVWQPIAKKIKPE